MTSGNLGFITSTRFFERVLKKTTVFFVEHNPAEIQSANTRGSRALAVLVQLALMDLIPGTLQIVFTLVTLGTLINPQVAAITAAYGAIAVTIAMVSARRSRGTSIARSRPGRRMRGSSAVRSTRWKRSGISAATAG